ncbi:MAG: PEF-CTERM sorting domain-containing protein, partial [Euryarchaeota archaeon]|nr:PEF-CTERM sorting domain-containing protein [Euryarchaeota archaeon]
CEGVRGEAIDKRCKRCVEPKLHLWCKRCVEPFDVSDVMSPTNYLGVILDVEIPEFSTIAVPVVAVIGLLLLMRRRKE